MWLFRAEPLHAIVARLRAALAAGEATFTLRVLDPDLGRGRHAGETVEHEGASYVHRPWRDADVTERYGADSPFARINKAEDPGFVVDLDDAVARLALPDAPRILDLGVNRGDELALLFALHPALSITAQVTGVDHSASALAVARTRFPAARCRFLEADLADLASLALGRFDLILSFGTLQSGELDDRALLRALVQDHLAPSGALILGLPNCRYVDGEVEHGARMKNFRQAELGLLFKDVAFYRKYLQQHRRRVYITGKHEVLLTAVPATAADRLEEE
jgi:trans-aconitate methyltransferase